uniref:Uncharacterized protein n=1 Tax=Rhizophora mucronata TaxID=61149 RepID=A0A2P2QJJ6_RHIMU
MQPKRRQFLHLKLLQKQLVKKEAVMRRL